MNRRQLLEKLDKAWAAFQESYAGLTDSQMMEPGVTADWSVKDIIAHVTAWEAEAIKYLPMILQGERLPRYAAMYGGIDAFNAQAVEQKRKISLSEVRDQQDKTHHRLINYLQTVPEGQFTHETRFRRRVRLDTYGHYPEHTRMIREWRSQLGR